MKWQQDRCWRVVKTIIEIGDCVRFYQGVLWHIKTRRFSALLSSSEEEGKERTVWRWARLLCIFFSTLFQQLWSSFYFFFSGRFDWMKILKHLSRSDMIILRLFSTGWKSAWDSVPRTVTYGCIPTSFNVLAWVTLVFISEACFPTQLWLKLQNQK